MWKTSSHRYVPARKPPQGRGRDTGRAASSMDPDPAYSLPAGRAPMHRFFSLSFNSSYVKWVVPSSGHSGEADMPCIVKAVQRCSSRHHTDSNNKSSREETGIA